jgi:hypothetical protein
MRSLEDPALLAEGDDPSASTASLAPSSRAASPFPPKARERLGIDDNSSTFTPYSDDPERGRDADPGALLLQQRHIMDGEVDYLAIQSARSLTSSDKQTKMTAWNTCRDPSAVSETCQCK